MAKKPKRPDLEEQKARKREQRDRIIELFRQGVPEKDIVRECRTSIKRVRNVIGWRIKNAAHIDKNDVRTFIDDQARKIITKAWPEYEKGNLEAGRIILSALERSAKLHGADMPAEVRHAGFDGGAIKYSDVSKLTDEELNDEIAALEQAEAEASKADKEAGGDTVH